MCRDVDMAAETRPGTGKMAGVAFEAMVGCFVRKMDKSEPEFGRNRVFVDPPVNSAGF